MATIENRDGKYKVSIRKKGFKEIYKSFSTKEDAELYISWKEDLMDQISAFDPSPEELLTLDQAVDMKIEDAKKRNLDHRTILGIQGVKMHFADYLDQSLSVLTYEKLADKLRELMDTKVSRGGGKVKIEENMKDASLKTISNRFRYLSAVIGYINTQGFSFQNNSTNIVSYLENKMKQKEL